MKQTPSNCDSDECAYNSIPPTENEQECIGCPYLVNENWMPTRVNTNSTPNTPKAKDLKIYEVINRLTGEKSFKAATTDEDASKQAGWLIGDCYIVEQQPRYKPVRGHAPALLVKIPCEICPYQFCECKKPPDRTCPVQPTAPTVIEWLKQAAQCHLCLLSGKPLTKADYQLRQKWLPLKEAIKELSPKPFPATQNPLQPSCQPPH